MLHLRRFVLLLALGVTSSRSAIGLAVQARSQLAPEPIGDAEE
jgi:hypothetical protein